ncbi:hypothetical protein Slin15195_G068400 [Septoria linicola]|uniref:Uncharacterized protein n=1 Tax=Septoria linicola TaxID=215465 RepID=A0A9Q9EJ77_9PEZI|nr:hypothetical protein Slin15195_G068400 [Septoria linicola]
MDYWKSVPRDEDFWLTIAIAGLLTTSLYRVVAVFAHHYQAQRTRVVVPGRKPPWRAVHVFLLRALGFAVAVIMIRWQLQRNWKGDLKEFQFRRGVRTLKEMNDFLRDQGEQLTIPIDETGFRYRAYQRRNAKLPKIFVEKVPWPPQEINTTSLVRDNLKLLFAGPRSVFWTRQWYMGFIAWPIYVVNTCVGRYDLGPTFALSCIVLAYLGSLAAMQAFLEAVILLQPERRLTRIRLVRPEWTGALAVIQALLLVAIPWCLRNLENDLWSLRQSWETQFMVLQALLLVVSLLAPIALMHRWALDERMLWAVRGEQRPGQDYRWAWTVTGASSLLLQLFSIWQCFTEPNPLREWRWTGMAFFQPWHDSSRHVFKHPLDGIYGLFGDHASVNAVAWDVISSAIWVVSHNCPKAKDMLRTSLLPQLDDGLGADGTQKTELSLELQEELLKHVLEAVDRHQSARGLTIFDPIAPLDVPPIANNEPLRKTRSQRRATAGVDDSSAVYRGRASGNHRASSTSQADTDGEVDGSSSRYAAIASALTSVTQGRLPGSTKESPSSGKERRNSITLAAETEGRAENVGFGYALFVLGGLGLLSSAAFGADSLLGV